jgi:hypothetical protein
MTIAQMVRNWNSIDVASESAWVMLDNREQIVQYNKDQLQLGVKNDNSSIIPMYKSNWYAKMKQGKNSKPEFGTPDLKLTGAFYDGIVIKMEGYNKYSVTSIDSKTSQLVSWYSSSIFGFTPRSRQEIQDEIMQDELIKRLKSKLFK